MKPDREPRLFADIGEFRTWLAERRASNEYEVTTTSLEGLAGWHAEAGSGDLVHRSGKFFALRGIRVRTNRRPLGSWSQPIIVQPEIGLLGIAVTVWRGEVYCLMQAKMEPGNINLIQLSPTVQATRSNYTQVHGGSAVPYLEYFMRPRPAVTVYDALQSEQGSWFLNKRNRNVIVRLPTMIGTEDDFCWLSLDQIAELLTEPNLVNMDTRTVLSGMPFIRQAVTSGRRSASLHSDEEVLSWFTELKTCTELDRNLVPLNELEEWRRGDGVIARADGRHFTVLGVHVRATNREVGEWWQPMLRPAGRGVIAFLGRHIDGVFHLLVHGRTEVGTRDLVEMAPTVNCIPDSYRDIRTALLPRYFDLVESAPPERLLVDVVHSEEGGRFYHAENRYLVVDAGDAFPLDVPLDYCWVTPGQLIRFTGVGNYVNVAARCLLTCLLGGPAGAAPEPALIGGFRFGDTELDAS